MNEIAQFNNYSNSSKNNVISQAIFKSGDRILRINKKRVKNATTDVRRTNIGIIMCVYCRFLIFFYKDVLIFIVVYINL